MAGVITQDIAEVRQATNDIAGSVDQVKNSAESLSEMAEKLYVLVNTFTI